METVTAKILGVLAETARELEAEGIIRGRAEFLEKDILIPRERDHGHLCTPALSRVATTLEKKEFFALFAARVTGKLAAGGIGEIERVEPFPPVFLNFFLRPGVLHDLLREAIAGKFICRDEQLAGKRYIIEFVSANPTGPLTIAHGRQAAFGESLSRLLAECGALVTREYYLNDEGRQIDLLGQSLRVRCRQFFGQPAELPEDGYRGDYLVEMAEALAAEHGRSLLEKDDDFFRGQAAGRIMAGIREDLAAFGVKFDSFRSQGDLEREGEVERTLRLLEEKQAVYPSGGALFLATSRFGDDKDRALRKSDGTFTYIMPDIAYHLGKIERRFDVMVNLWGPDHYGYINRLKAALAILGHDPEKLRIIIVQLTTLYRGGEKVAMSTRQGEFLPLSRLVSELSPDIGKFFFLSRKADSHLDFDLELARRDSAENPVYYLQYASARIASIFRRQADHLPGFTPGDAPLELLVEPEEKEIMILLGRFPQAVISAARSLEPQVVFSYLMTLVKLFHRYYQRCRILLPDPALSAARLSLVAGLDRVLRKGLLLLNVEAPREM